MIIVFAVVAIAILLIVLSRVFSQPRLPMGGYPPPTYIQEIPPPPMYVEPDPFVQGVATVVGVEIAADVITDVAMDVGSMFDGGGGFDRGGFDQGDFDPGGF
jgi:hypothetical protein